jgi:hypothetical protein
MEKRRAVSLGGGGRAALLCLLVMSFSFGPTSSPPTLNPQIDYIRGLVFDTQQFNAQGGQGYIWSDEEILMYEQMQTYPFQSSQFFSGPGGQFVPPTPIDYYRVAGVMMMALSANKAALASIEKVLDVQVDPSKAAKALQDTAQGYFTMSDNIGAFMIIEQVNDYWSFSDRFWKQVQRQQGV